MTGRINCPECDGEGTVEREVWVRQTSSWHGDFEDHTEDCDNCNGLGSVEAPLHEGEE